MAKRANDGERLYPVIKKLRLNEDIRDERTGNGFIKKADMAMNDIDYPDKEYGIKELENRLIVLENRINELSHVFLSRLSECFDEIKHTKRLITEDNSFKNMSSPNELWMSYIG